MAEYRALAEAFRSAGAALAGVSADLPVESEALRRDRTEARVPPGGVLAFIHAGMRDDADEARGRFVVPRLREWRGAWGNGQRRRRLRRG